jgi:hypothetical protein
MSQLPFPNSSFIFGDYMAPEICDELIEYFKYNLKYTSKGQTGSKNPIDEEIKESIDLSVGAKNLDNIILTYRIELDKILKKYLEKFTWANDVEYFDIREDYNIQFYPIKGGFKKWHTENNGRESVIKRHLVFMTYLNDVEDGGTEFYYQDIKTKAEKGLTIVWPAQWTHTHKGIISQTKEKYIVTGWFSF